MTFRAISSYFKPLPSRLTPHLNHLSSPISPSFAPFRAPAPPHLPSPASTPAAPGPPFRDSPLSSLPLSSSSLPIPSILSYNVHSLSFYSSDSRSLLRRTLIHSSVSDFAKDHDIICLQETHLASSETFAFASLPNCIISRNNLDMSHAGTLIIDTPSIIATHEGSDVPLPPIARGRVQLRRYLPRSNTHSPFQLFNVYFKSGGDFSFNASLIKAISNVDRSIPTFLCGDLNFIESRDDSTSASPLLPPTSFVNAWDTFKALFNLFDPLHTSHTFYHISNNPTSPYSWSSRLDRFLIPSSLAHNPTITPFVSIPNHHTNLKVASSNRLSSFSDHLPIHLTYESDDTSQRGPSIPTWLASSPEFAANLRKLWTPSNRAGAYSQLRSYKKVLFKAAKVTREEKIKTQSKPLSLSHHLTLLRQIQSVTQNSSTISSIISLSPSLSSLVSFVGNRWVDTGLLQATLGLLNEVSPPPKPHTSLAKALSLKAPTSRARVGPLRPSPDEEEVHSDHDRSRVAADFWGKIWAKRSNPPSHEERIAFLSSYPKTVNSSLIRNLDCASLIESIKRTSNSCAGPDGISFAAWRAAPDLAAPILLAVLKALSAGQPPPVGFNLGLLFLLPKKHTGLVADTRPLSVTNTDNRILAAAVAHSIMPAVLQLVDPSQKGFLDGRSGSDHTMAINKFFYEGVESRSDRLLFLLDTAKAFDSIDHDWIHLVLERMGFPPWLKLFVRGILSEVKVSPFFGGNTSTWIDIERGVKQGCPLSPLLFLLAYDPLLYSLSNTPNITCYAFADDLAITTFSILSIHPALSLIDLFSTLSGMGVNRNKSLVLSTSHPRKHPSIRSGLLSSPWPDLPLRSRGVHLGIAIGRDVTLDEIWDVPVNKAISRIKNSSHFIKSLPMSSRIAYVNIFIISIFSYVGLFFVLPHDTWKKVRGEISRAVIPYNGGGFTYETLTCATSHFNVKPALKDVWAFNISLLASRSPLISSKANYNNLPYIDVSYTKLITKHRDAAAVDFWRGHHLPDGTLVPLSSSSSSSLYDIILFDVFFDLSASHLANKLHTTLSPYTPSPPDPLSLLFSLSSALFSLSSVPPFLIFHHIYLINNALPTSRRTRHQLSIPLSSVSSCFFCGEYEDSYKHIYSSCYIISRARTLFLSSLRLPLPLPPHYTTPAENLRWEFPLAWTFLCGVDPNLVKPLLAFNFAVWKFRKPSMAARMERDPDWICARISELATNYHRMFPKSSPR